MNLRELIGRARERFSQRELPAPPPVSAPGQQQAPVTIVMPGQQSRKLSTPVVIVGVGVCAIALYFAGHGSAKVDTPAVSRGSDPTPTSPANIKDWNKPAASPFAGKTAAQQAEEAYGAQQTASMQQQQAAFVGGFGQTQTNAGDAGGGAPALTPAQQLAEDRRKADEESLHASTVIAIPDTPVPQPVNSQGTQQPAIQYSAPPVSTAPSSATAAAPAEDKTRKDCVDRMDGDVKKYALCEGAVLPAISEFRLVGEFAGPVKAEIASDIFSRDGKHILIPRGTIALGDAKRVGTANQRRMAAAWCSKKCWLSTKPGRPRCPAK